MKLYFRKDDDHCYTIEAHREYMKENGIEQMELIVAEREKATVYFWCKHFGAIGEVGESCGKVCEAYAPRNGKNGRCRYSGSLYAHTEKRIIINSSENPDSSKDELIEFAIYLTGHDKQTIEQMYADYKKHKK